VMMAIDRSLLVAGFQEGGEGREEQRGESNEVRRDLNVSEV
jgi:hypothetical protein